MQELLVDDREAAGLRELGRLAAQEAAVFAAQARQLHDSGVLSARLHGAHGPERFLVLDVAATLRVGQGAAGQRMADASRLVETLTGTLGGLTAGTVFVGQARIVLELTAACTDRVAAEVDRRLHSGAPDLTGWTARRLRDRLRRLVLVVEADLDPLATARREATARARRKVSVRPEPDGMGSLWALLPAEQLRQFTLGLDELHRRQLVTDRATGIDRTADQRRADLIAMLPALALHALDGSPPLVSADGSCTHPAILLNVHIPMATALGLSQEPATLDGYGPLSASHARLLIPAASLRAVLVDERTGVPLHLDPTLHPPGPSRRERRRPRRPDRRTSRAHVPDTAVGATHDGTALPVPPDIDLASWVRLSALVPDEPVLVRDDPEPHHDPSARLARLVRARDPLCTGLGCSQGSGRSELDHVDPWPHGPTALHNLRPKSTRCHRAKTFSWSVRHHGDGAHTWTSPTGRSYTVPAYWVPPPVPRAPVISSEARAHDPEPDDLEGPGPAELTPDLDDGVVPARQSAYAALAQLTLGHADEPPF